MEERKEDESPPEKSAQAVEFLLAHFIFPTPFLSIPHQEIGNIEEWCCFIWGVSPSNGTKKAKWGKFSVLYRKSPAFLYRIRGPPSEI